MIPSIEIFVRHAGGCRSDRYFDVKQCISIWRFP